MIKYIILSISISFIFISNAIADDCNSSIYYLCDAKSDTLLIFDKITCELMEDQPKSNCQTIKIKENDKNIESEVPCKLKNRDYLLKTTFCKNNLKDIIPLVTVSSEGKDIFTGSYHGECENNDALIYFHHATSSEVQIGKRTLKWGNR